jgi:hypothetical protein
MVPPSGMTKILLSSIIWACASDAPCPPVDCAIGVAFTVTVTSSTSGAPVPGSYVAGNPFGGSPTCNDPPGTTCTEYGSGGKYTIQIGAPGFESVQRTITVSDDGSRCCALATPGHLDVALVPVT